MEACRGEVAQLPSKSLSAAGRGCNKIEMHRFVPDESVAHCCCTSTSALSARRSFCCLPCWWGTTIFTVGLNRPSGNRLAPAFTLLHCPLVAAALRRSWRGGERREEIRVGTDCVEKIPAAGSSPALQAPLYVGGVCRSKMSASCRLPVTGRLKWGTPRTCRTPGTGGDTRRLARGQRWLQPMTLRV